MGKSAKKRDQPSSSPDLVEEVVTKQGDKELLFEALKRYQSSSDVKRLVQDLRRVLNEPTRLEVYDYVRPLIRPQHQQAYDKITPTAPGTKARIIKLRRRGHESFGFAVRGGFEHGIGIFVSRVDKGSQAELRGLKMGDEIVRVNGFTIAEAIHDEVLNLIKGRDEIELKVTSIGMVPIKQNPMDPVTWQYVDKTALTKQQPTPADQPEETGNVTKIFINMHGAQSLGCTIVSGPKQFPGIYIETVRPGSLAETYLLEVGDQIMEVNGKSFLEIKHKEAIVELKGSKELNMVIKKHTGVSLFNMKKGRQSPGAGRKNVVETEIEHHADQDSADLICEVLEQDEREEQVRLQWEEEQAQIRQDREIADMKRREEEKRRMEEEGRQAAELERQAEIERQEREIQLEEERRRREEEREQMEKDRLRQKTEQKKQEEKKRKEEERRLAEERKQEEEMEERKAFIAKKQESAVLGGRSGPGGSMKPKLLGAASVSKSSFGSLSDKIVKNVVIHKDGDLGLDMELEGGLGTPLGGKIIVGDVYHGGLVHMSGEIKKSDTLLKANGVSLVDVTLSAAQELLWELEQSNQTIELTVEEGQFRDNDNETTYF